MGVALNLLVDKVNKLDYLFSHMISRCRLCAKDKGLRLKIHIRIILEIKIKSYNIERIEKLAFIFMQAFYLNVEERVSIENLACFCMKMICEIHLVLMLDRAKLGEYIRAIGKFHKFGKLCGILAISRSDAVIKQRGKARV